MPNSHRPPVKQDSAVCVVSGGVNWVSRPSGKVWTHWRNFILKSGADQRRRQDLVSGGHDDRGAEGASIETPPKAPRVVGYGEGCPLPSRLGDLGQRRELPQQSPGRYRIFCIF